MSAERVSVEVGRQIIAVEGDSVVCNINIEDNIVGGLSDRDMVTVEVSLAIITGNVRKFQVVEEFEDTVKIDILGLLNNSNIELSMES